jgi:NADH-quinone oxidoreductase subunit C
MTSDLITRLATMPGVTSVEDRADGIWVEAGGPVEAMADTMNELGLRLGTMTAIPLDDGETTLIYHYLSQTGLINVRTTTRGNTQASLATLAKPADWCEREIKDLFAVAFPGHPNPVPLMRPGSFEEGLFRAPMCAARAAAKKA